jgi:hypothetical protein
MKTPIYGRIVTTVLEGVIVEKLYRLNTSTCKESPKNK